MLPFDELSIWFGAFFPLETLGLKEKPKTSPILFSSGCNDANAIPTRSRYTVRTPPRSLDDMDGRGWEVRGWVANG